MYVRTYARMYVLICVYVRMYVRICMYVYSSMNACHIYLFVMCSYKHIRIPCNKSKVIPIKSGLFLLNVLRTASFYTCPQWYYYVRQRHNAMEWKCQPTKWISPELERHEILLGSLSLLVTNFVTAVITCYISNGGWCMTYYLFNEYTWAWWFLQWPIIFIYQVRRYILLMSQECFSNI
jgi:hypothetical protein